MQLVCERRKKKKTQDPSHTGAPYLCPKKQLLPEAPHVCQEAPWAFVLELGSWDALGGVGGS